MKIKATVLMAAMGCSLMVLTGCISEEEHLIRIKEVETAKDAIIAQLEQDLAKEQGKLKDEQSRMRTLSIQLEESEAKKIDLQKKEAEVSKQLADANMTAAELEERMKRLKSELTAESDAKTQAKEEYKELADEYAKLLDKYNQMRDNMANLSASNSQPKKVVVEQPKPASVEKTAAAPQSDADIVRSLLDGMSTK